MTRTLARIAAYLIERIFGVGLRLVVETESITIKAKNMETSIAEGQTFTLAVTGQSKRGEVVPISGVPSWSSSDPSIVTVAPADGGLFATVTGVTRGTATVTVSIDGFSDTDTVTVTQDMTLAGIALANIALTAANPT
jgi:uncharacterized protein YjdB